MATARKINLDRALFDPASVFTGPDAVVEHESLGLENKIEILRRWAYDAIEMAVAEEEGMGGGETVAVDTILAALERLEVGRHCAQQAYDCLKAYGGRGKPPSEGRLSYSYARC